jgi:hypothetical protein
LVICLFTEVGLKLMPGKGSLMALEFSIHEEPGYLVIGVEGTFEIGDMKRMIQTLMVEGKKRGYDRALVDISKIEGPIKQFDRFLIGQHAAENWREGLRVAVVYRAEEINKFAEGVATSRGANLRVLADVESALHWLLEDLPEAD